MCSRIFIVALFVTLIGLPVQAGVIQHNFGSSAGAEFDLAVFTGSGELGDVKEVQDCRFLDSDFGAGMLPSFQSVNLIPVATAGGFEVPGGSLSLLWSLKLVSNTLPPSPVLDGLLKPA